MAPSAWNLQPWRFVVVTDHETRQKLQEAAYNQRQVGQAPVVVVLYCDMVDALRRVDDQLHPNMAAEAKAVVKANIERAFAAMTPEQRDHWGNAQGNILLGYLLLLFEVHGFGTSPMLGFDPPAVRALLGLPDHAAIPALIAVGHAAGPHAGPPHRLKFGEVSRFVGA
jgi:nitroreductase